MSTPHLRPVTMQHPLDVPPFDLLGNDTEDRYEELSKLVNKLEAEIADLKFIVARLQQQLEQREL